MHKASFADQSGIAAHATLLEWQRAVRRMQRLSSTEKVDEMYGDRLGTATWASEIHGILVALTWEWREVLPRIVALSNPLGVSCNVVLHDEKGVLLSEKTRVLYLNGAISRLPWQGEFKLPHDSSSLAA